MAIAAFIHYSVTCWNCLSNVLALLEKCALPPKKAEWHRDRWSCTNILFQISSCQRLLDHFRRDLAVHRDWSDKMHWPKTENRAAGKRHAHTCCNKCNQGSQKPAWTLLWTQYIHICVKHTCILQLPTYLIAFMLHQGSVLPFTLHALPVWAPGDMTAHSGQPLRMEQFLNAVYHLSSRARQAISPSLNYNPPNEKEKTVMGWKLANYNHNTAVIDPGDPCPAVRLCVCFCVWGT